MYDKVSIIIPTYNRKRKLKKCIDSILSQDISKKRYEIIVVDDCSKDNTISILESFNKKIYNLKYEILSNRKGPGNARNIGVKISSGDILVFTDSDCILDKNYLKNILELHNINKDYEIMGGYTYTNRFNLKSKIVQFMINGAIYNKIYGEEQVIFFPTCNVSLKRSVFAKEKFNENFKLPGGEDLEFFWRLYKKKYKFLYDKSIKVFHNLNLSFFDFLIHPFTYGKENFYVKKIHKDHPALQDLRCDGTVEFFYSIMKEFIKSFFLSIKLSNKFKTRQKSLLLNTYLMNIFYFFMFRLAYLSGFLVEFIKVNFKNKL